MAKRIIKDPRIQTIIKNIAADFRFTHEVGDYALLFYKAESEGVISGKAIDEMTEYVETGLKELQDTIEWRRQYISEHSGADEIKMLENLRTIEEEYTDLLKFLKR